MWARFFQSIGGHSSQDGESESVVSDSHVQAPGTPSAMREEVHPNDSASVAYEDDPVAGAVGVIAPSSLGGIGSPAAVDDGTYLFKFLSPSGITHRFQARYDSHDLMHDIVSGKLASDPFFIQRDGEGDDSINANKPDPGSFSVFYTDDDGDFVLLSSDRDVEDAVLVAKKQGKDRVVLTLRGGRGWEDAMQHPSEAADNRRPVKNKLVKPDEGLEGEEVGEVDRPTKHSGQDNHHHRRRKAGGGDDELLFGVVPRDLALPAAVAFLGVAVLGVFALSRTSGR
jgi:PB1 domain